ncbi:MAG: N-acetylglucosamine-specific PTS transporter subunit IIBC [Bacillota bacterium]|nr:N-acetylglucosamine-specific PTS transporter subunit IIBC [Bacillota bacterium]
MSKGNNKVLTSLQRLGKSLMTPVAALPAAALLLRIGQADVWKPFGILPNGIPWMAAAGNAIFGNLALIFAVGIAVGLADENNGVAGLAAVIGYYVLTTVATTFNKDINMGVLAGIFVGILAAYLYNKYKAKRLPDFLGFFGGRRFVPIVTSFWTLVIGVIMGYVWPLIQDGINAFGNAVANAGAIGAFIFGVLNRLLIPFGLHHVLNSLFWFQFGSFTNAAGKVITGDLNRFFALDPNAGTYMTGFFPIMMFGLPAACLAMITAAKKENKKAVTGMFLGIALTSFLTGITEPIEFSFMFLAPGLYAIHALLSGTALAVTSLLGIKAGFGFSAGLFDMALNWGISTKPVLLLIVCLVYAVIYYFVFLFFIKKFNIPTPGRAEDEESATLSGLNDSELSERAALILEALGNKANIDSIDACVTRIRTTVKDGALVDEKKLKELGATGVMKMGEKNYQVIVGTVADPLVTHIKDVMKRK